MKKITLLVASVLLYGNLANASAIMNHSDGKNKIDFNQNEPIEFIERGIAFYVFPNGEFDFNTRPLGPRYHVNGTNGAPGTRGYYGPLYPRTMVFV